MKTLLTTLLLAALTTAAPAAQMIGGTMDAHGCIGPAGYEWSMVQKRCVRAWEAGYKLAPLNPTNNALAAYVVFPMGADQTRAELYLASEKTPLLARRVVGARPATWQIGAYRLTRAAGLYGLSKGGKLLYQGASAH